MPNKIDKETNFMQCKGCGRRGCKYTNQQRDIIRNEGDMVGVDKRTDFTARCNKCGWVGELRY